MLQNFFNDFQMTMLNRCKHSLVNLHFVITLDKQFTDLWQIPGLEARNQWRAILEVKDYSRFINSDYQIWKFNTILLRNNVSLSISRYRNYRLKINVFYYRFLYLISTKIVSIILYHSLLPKNPKLGFEEPGY